MSPQPEPLSFPAWLYGPVAEVRRAAGRKATALRRGRSFAEIAEDA